MMRTLVRFLTKVSGIIIAIILILVMAYDIEASEYSSNYEKIPAVERTPPKVAGWLYTPTVLVCENAPVDSIRTRSSVVFWQNLGYDFYKTLYKKDPLNKCTSAAPLGFIVIKLVSQDILINMKNTTLAQTQFYVNNGTGKREWAIIYLRRDPQGRVLEHEIGHALGFLHYNKIGHLMHEAIPSGGWGIEGLHMYK